MSRYIDADALKERLLAISVVADDLYGMGINRGLDRAETAIDMMPTANVAREIFEEIERLLDKHHSACHPIGAIEAYTYYEGGLCDAIADLKKKYESEGAE